MPQYMLLIPKLRLKPGRLYSVPYIQTKLKNLKQEDMQELLCNCHKIPDAIAIPSEALIPEMDGEKVFIYKNGIAQSVKVNTGLRTESKVQITDGLNFGDTLITSGIMQLRQNLPVVLDSVILNN